MLVLAADDEGDAQLVHYFPKAPRHGELELARVDLAGIGPVRCHRRR
jgi:hypothetical protein